MITRRIAAGLIGAGIILSGTAYATQPNPDHKITICHSGNGKHFTSVKVDYAGARGHAKTDSDDIIPAFEDFPGQGDQSILENSCNEATTTTTQSTPTTSAPSSTTTSSTVLPTTTTTILPATTMTTLGTSITTSPTTAIPPSSTSTTTLPPASTITTTVVPSSPVTTINIPSTTQLSPRSTPTPTLVTVTMTTGAVVTSIPTPHAPTVERESLPVTGSEPTDLVYGGLALLALGLILVIVSR